MSGLLTRIISNSDDLPLWSQIVMQLLACREHPVIDCQTLAEFIGRERLFRGADGSFLLHMSSDGKVEEERIARLSVRDAISWLNEAPDQFGFFWEFAEIIPPVQQPFHNPHAGAL
jgi:hypothetical protein